MNDTDIRYSRQRSLAAVGPDGQAKLAAARVLIVGAGGLGNPAGMYLAAGGVGHIVISDFDTVDVSNLPRQVLFRDADAGFPKAEIMALRLAELNPSLTAVGISRRLDKTALQTEIGRATAVLDCTDNFTTRWLLNELCHATATPLVSGAAIRCEGQLTVFPFGDQSTPCYRCLYDESDENLLDCAGQGILGPVAGTIGTLMATETIKLLTGHAPALAGRLWLYDGMTGDTRTITIKPRPDCPVCGQAARSS